jgi:hypothetical protein
MFRTDETSPTRPLPRSAPQLDERTSGKAAVDRGAREKRERIGADTRAGIA